MAEELAMLGGEPVVTMAHPHYVWPPPALADELKELAQQRNKDISLKGLTGPVKDFEDAFRQFLDNKVRFMVSFNSGTSALLAAYVAIGVSEGDEIIGPSLTFHAALSPICLLRAIPVLVDIDMRTRCIDPQKIEEKVSSRTRAITVVHQWGHPADMDAIMTIAAKHNLLVVEDCSHAHGSRYKGRLCGTFGDIGVFSLQASKAVFAGEGGILVTNDATYHDRATLLGHYRDRAEDEVLDPDLQQYWVTGFGLKLRMTPLSAVIAKHSLKHYRDVERGRHKCLRYFMQRLGEVDYIEPPYVAAEVHMGAWYGFKPLYRTERLHDLPRHELIRALRAEGVQIHAPSGPLLATLPLYSGERDPIYREQRSWRASRPEDYPMALQVQESALSLPTFYDWDKHKRVIDGYVEAFKKVGRLAVRLPTAGRAP